MREGGVRKEREMGICRDVEGERERKRSERGRERDRDGDM